MVDNTPSLTDFARRMRHLVEEDVRIAADLRELAKEMRACGHRPVVVKAIVKALVLAEEYDNPKPLEALKERAQDVAVYGAALGIEIEGFGEPKRNGVNDCAFPGAAAMADTFDAPTPPDEFDPETGEVIEPAATEPPAAIPAASETEPSEPSPDAVLPAGESPSSQSGQGLDPIPVQSHIVREPEPYPEMPPFLDRRARPIPSEEVAAE